MCSWSPNPTISSFALSFGSSIANARSSLSICFSCTTRPTNRMRFSCFSGHVGRVVVGVDRVRDREHRAHRRVVLEELGGLAGGRRDSVGARVRPGRGIPRQTDCPALHGLWDEGVLEQVLRHEVIRAHEADAALACADGEPAARDDVGLEVHDVWLDLIEDLRGVLLDAPRQREPQPRLRVPAPAVDAPHRERRTVVRFHLPTGEFVRRGWRGHLHIVPTLQQPLHKVHREGHGPVDIWRERVADDEDAQAGLRGVR